MVEKKSYNPEQAKQDFAALQSKNLLGERGIGRNPYWLKMIVEIGLYTRNRGELFYEFAEKLIRREINEKPQRRLRKPDWKPVPFKVEMDALACLAIAMHQEKRIGFSGETGWNKARTAIRDSLGDSLFTPDDILGEAEAATLLRIRYRDRVEFVHQLVQEFFAAYALQSQSRWQVALLHCEDIWWWQTLFLLGGRVGSNDSSQLFCQFVQEILGDGSNDQRLFVAIGVLCSVENPSVDLLTKVISIFATSVGDTLTPTQLSAAQELGRILGDEAAEEFGILFHDPDHDTKRKGAMLLCALKNKRANEILLAALRDKAEPKTMVKILSSVGELVIEPLITIVRGLDSNDEVHKYAVEIFEKIGAVAVLPLIVALHATERNVCRLAVEALGKIGDRRAVEPLISILQNNDTVICGLAAKALGQIGDPRAVTPLIDTLRNPAKWLRCQVAEALGKIGDLLGVEPLIAVLGERHFSDTKLWECMEKALVEFGASAIPALVTALGSSNMAIQGHAANVLEKIGEPVIPFLVSALHEQDDEMHSRARRVLEKIFDTSTVEPLIMALHKPDRYIRLYAAFALGKIGDPCAVEPLIVALRDSDNGVRQSAINALGEIGDQRAVEPLISALHDPDENVRKATIESLEEIGDTNAVEPLIAVLSDQHNSVRFHAAKALGKIGNSQAISPLVETLLHDQDKEVRSEAAMALGEIGDRRAVMPLVEIMQALIRDKLNSSKTNTLPKNSDKQVDKLPFRIARDPDHNICISSISALGKIGDRRAMAPLIEILQNPDQDIRSCAADALGEIGDPQAVEPLVEIFHKSSKRDGIDILKALWKIGDHRAIKPLIEALADPDKNIRSSATTALWHIGKAAVEPLIAILQGENIALRVKVMYVLEHLCFEDSLAVKALIGVLSDDSNEYVRLHVLSAFRSSHHFDKPDIVKSFINALHDPAEQVRKYARDCLVEHITRVNIDASIMALLIKKLNDSNREVRLAVASILGELTDWRTVGPLITALSDPDKDVRLSVIYALRQIRNRRAVQPLIAALQDSDIQVCEQIIDTLGTIGDPLAVEPLINALRHQSTQVRRAAANALKEIADPRAVEPLIAALNDSNLSMRRNVAYALGGIGDLRAVEPLIIALHGSNSKVRQLATSALIKIHNLLARVPLIDILNDIVDDILDDLDADVREAAAYALGEIGDTPAVEPLISTLHHWKAGVRKSAVEALGKIGNARALPELEHFAKVAKEDEDNDKKFRGSVAEAAQDAVKKIRQRTVSIKGG